MQVSNGRGVTRTNGVVAGSVWEARMKLDQVKGGIKVFNGEDSREDDVSNPVDDVDGIRVYGRRLRRNQSEGVADEKRKRRSWKTPESAVFNGGADKSPIQLGKSRSEISKPLRFSDGISGRQFGGNKIGMGNLGNVGRIGDGELLVIGNGGEDGRADDAGEIEIEMEKKGIDLKEVDFLKEKPKNVEEEKKIDQEMDLFEEKPMNVEEEKKINQIRRMPILSNVKTKQGEGIVHPAVDPNLAKPPPVEVAEDFFKRYESVSETQKRTQSIVDLVMWRDISRSAFVFGIGGFLLLSSSYTKDINFSLISAISYLGLVYLAVIFLYKSILHRGVADFDETTTHRCVLGEEEAIWLLRLLLPYINELLIKLRALFSGDPATTMKVAVLLFVLARCGGSITIWTMVKLAFFGLFTIPKICSSYSVQLARYGKFWLERFRDGWESCAHKKAVAGAIFTLIWNLSSTGARIWAVFMLVVGIRFYQQSRVEEWGGGSFEEEAVEVKEEDLNQGGRLIRQQGPGRGQRYREGPAEIEVVMKDRKKGC